MRTTQASLALTLALVGFLAAAPSRASAHPHMSLESRLEFELDGRRCVGIRVEWIFDSLFSAAVIGEHDRNRDGGFDAAENERVRTRAFSNLARYGYFLFIRQGSVRACPEKTEQFEASQRDGRLVYRFRVPLEGKTLGGDLSVAVFDATFYCAVRYAAEAAAIHTRGSGAGTNAAIVVAQNKSYPVYYNPKGAANDFRVYDRWEQGLETAYPEEITLRLAE